MSSLKLKGQLLVGIRWPTMIELLTLFCIAMILFGPR